MIQKLDHPAPKLQPKKKAGQKHFKVAEKDIPKLDFQGQWIESADELESLIAPWNRLCAMSVRKNLFFDPDFLIPAFKHLNQSGAKILMVDAPQRGWADGPRVLCGLLPMVKRRFYGFPLSCLEVWKHDQCFDCTPLIRRDCSHEVLQFIFSFLAEQKTGLISFDTIAGEGDFDRLLTENLYQNKRTVFHRDAFTRACFSPDVDAETFINTQVAKSTRKGTQRLERRMGELGTITTQVSVPGENAQPWADEFLELESSGWKGDRHTSLGSTEPDRKFFTEMVTRTLDSGKMSMLKVELDGRPISMLCDLQDSEHAIHFKTAYDESYSQFTPGLIAELKNIDRLHANDVSWMDSCADPDHSMINRVWTDRTRYQSLVVALGGPVSRIATSLMPLIQLASKIRQ